MTLASPPEEELDPSEPLKYYGQVARRIGSQVRDALTGKTKVSPQPQWIESWMAYALYWGRSQLSLEGVIQNADIVAHAIPGADEIAWGLLRLRIRTWLWEEGSLYGLTAEGRDTLEGIIVKGDLRKSWEALDEWVSKHPPPSTE